MKYNSVEELYKVIEGGIDVYFEESGIYVFIYAERGSIAYYYLDKDELVSLAEEAGPDDYIGGMLGPGGYIVDPNIKLANGTIVEYGTDEFSELENQYPPKEDWEYDYTPIYEFLEQYINEECIDAMPSDLVDFEEE